MYDINRFKQYMTQEIMCNYETFNNNDKIIILLDLIKKLVDENENN